MSHDPLRRLLRAADDVLAATRWPRVTAESLLPAARRRRTQTTLRRSAAAMLGVAGVALCAALVRPQAPPRELAVTRPPLAAELRANLASLRSALAVHESVVRELAQAPTLMNFDVADADSHPVNSAAPLWQAETIRSAGISWHYATMAETEFGDAAIATLEYRRIIDRFPETRWAEMAAVSLRRLAPTGDQSPL